MSGEGFAGFPPGRLRVTPVPNLFFSELLPTIDHLGDLKITLYAFWALAQKEGPFRYLTLSAMQQDALLQQALEGIDLHGNEALQEAVAEITGLEGFELKRVMRTGTVATIDNRNWELRDHHEPVRRLSQSRAIALDMESATIAANGLRLRVPYGTLLCVSDKPLHGELKLPGMASEFYKRQVGQHLEIGIRAMQKLSEMAPERLHSRKLRSFTEAAFQ